MMVTRGIGDPAAKLDIAPLLAHVVDEHDVDDENDRRLETEDCHSLGARPVAKRSVETNFAMEEEEEYVDADENNYDYLETGATRVGSILLEDYGPSVDGRGDRWLTTGLKEDGSVLSLTKGKELSLVRPWYAYLLLFVAVVSLSSIGPLLVLQDDATPTMKIVWRMMGTSMLLSPVVAYEVYTFGFPRLDRYQWATFLLATISYDVMTLAFVNALRYTSVGNACVLANSLPLILLVGNLCLGHRVSWMEGWGAVVAFSGAALVSKDSSENTMEGSNTLLGDALAILSAFGGVGYMIFAKSSRSNMSTPMFMFSTMALGATLAWIFQIYVLGETSTFSTDYEHGLWGFLLPVKHRLPLECFIVVVCNLCGTMGYVRVMQYFDNLVISSVGLLEPAIAQFLAVGYGVGVLPGIQGWTGNVLVVCGTFAVIYEDAKDKSHVSLNEELLEEDDCSSSSKKSSVV